MPSGARFVFGPYELDSARRRLTASGGQVAISERQIDVLLTLVTRAGHIVSKDDLLQAGWKDVAVGDNSLEQVISSLRKLLSPGLIETIARRGYRFTAEVERRAARESDEALDGLLAPHRAFLEGRAALESLEAGNVLRARKVFESALDLAPEHASSHIGLANACAMQYEMTRADPAPDVAALAEAARHAREACRLDPQSGEAWATLGFVLERTGDRVDAIASTKRAVTLEPDNWRHHFRLAYVGWGEERLRAAHRTLILLPDFPLAHWLAATVHVARQALPEAGREIGAALALDEGLSKFGAVALNWLLGLLLLEEGDEARALEAFERELAAEAGGHLYARECSANTWYAIGALRLRQARPAEAAAAFGEALARVPAHPLARVGLAVSGAEPVGPNSSGQLSASADSIEPALVHAARLVASNAHAEAARFVDDALARAPAGSAGWLLPLEPLLHVSAHQEQWARPLARLRHRAS